MSNSGIFILGGAVLVAAALGGWRWLFVFFKIRPAQLTVRALGLSVSATDDEERINSVLAAFAGGFNAMITRPSWRGWQAHCASLPPRTRPFAEEGAAMGYTLRRLFRFRPDAFERDIVRPRPEFRYLYYVGLGFWSGMRNHSPRRLEKITAGLDPLHRFLCFDGYGFKVAFFDYPADPTSLRGLDAFDGYARSAAYQGVGRALWFRFVDAPERFVEQVRLLGENAVDVAAGAGLAAVFVNPDRLDVAQAWASKMPAEWQPHFHLGMCFALKARSINHLEQFEADVRKVAPPVRDAVWAAIRECDRVELLVRSENRPDAYEQWRSRVTQWMVEHLEYPLAGVRRRVERNSTIEMKGGRS